jgi:hypothetical protein
MEVLRGRRYCKEVIL